MPKTVRARTLALVAALLSSALALGACGGSDGGAGGAATGGAATGGAAAGYPVTVDTQFGSLTLKDKPERIVVLGSPVDVDLLAALGEPAAAYSAPAADGADEASVLAPWLGEDSYGTYAKGLFDADFKPAREAIAQQDPDLIVFFGAGAPLDKTGYRQLSQIAPTYAYVSLPPWREEAATMGKLTGKVEQARTLVQKMDSQFAAARRQLAGLQGKTFFHGVATPNGIYSVPGATLLFRELGLTPASNQSVPPQRPRTFSAENVDQITADVVFLGGSGSPRTSLEKDPRFAELPSVKNKAMVFLQPLLQRVTIPSQIGPASVPWLLERLVPQLERSPLSSGK